MGSFTLDVRNFVEKTKRNNETVMRQVSFKLFSAIIKASPVDTGRFRMNWQAAGATPADGITQATDQGGGKAISNAGEYVLKAPNWFEFTLTNNLPYANVIEYGGYPGDGPNTIGGYSRQAPAGIVRITIKQFNKLLEEESDKVR